jgi:hypothetical protein
MRFFPAIPRHRPILMRTPVVFLGCVLGCAAALPPFAAHAQNAPASPSAHSQAQPALAAPAAAPTSPSQAAAAPATVTLANGKLTVAARNSDLTAILQQVASSSGMSIEGLGKSMRVFGVYGPGDPRDVLTDLLTGSGYNFAMLGSGSNGAPLRLVLTEKTAASGPAASPASSDDRDDADSEDADQQLLGPGAIPHPSPQFTDSTDPQARAERNLQRLQQERQQMEQQQQANPQ